MIFLHGLGGNKYSLADLGDYCKQRIPRAEIVLLQGPFNFGAECSPSYGWFVPPGNRHRAIEDPQRRKPEGLAVSVAYIHDEIGKLIAEGIHSEDVHLIGHSQGGAAAIAAGLAFEVRLGSVSTIAAYLSLDEEITPVKNGTPYHLHHSLHDNNVTVEWSEYAKNYIERVGCECQVRCWDIPNNAHGIHTSQINAICDSILARA